MFVDGLLSAVSKASVAMVQTEILQNTALWIQHCTGQSNLAQLFVTWWAYNYPVAILGNCFTGTLYV